MIQNAYQILGKSNLYENDMFVFSLSMTSVKSQARYFEISHIDNRLSLSIGWKEEKSLYSIGTRTNKQTHKHIHTHTHTHTHRETHTSTHRHTHTYTHAQTDTQLRVQTNRATKTTGKYIAHDKTWQNKVNN